MKKIAVVTDSNSGITQKEAEGLGLHVLPMPFVLDGELYYEDISLTQEEFYKKLMNDSEISTSQPAIGSVTKLWDELLAENDELVHIPMSSGLSASYETAALLAKEYDNRVRVVDNHRISVTLRQSAIDAVTLAAAGWDALKIGEYLEKVCYESSIYIMVNTLKYLKNGGRVTPAAAAVGSILNIKPILQIQGDKLDSYAKARGTKQARTVLIDALKHDFENRFAGYADPRHMWLQMAYSYDEAAALSFRAEVETAFPGYDIVMRPLSLSVACHIGPGSLAVACSRKSEY